MNKNKNNNGCGCDCHPQPAPVPPVDINMSACDRNINMLPMLQTYTTKVLKPNINGCCKKNILTQQMMNCEHYKYVIKWDFDLNGKTITVPENCILEFDGGSLKNGTIVGQNTVFINVGDVDIWGENLTREGTWREHSGGGGSYNDEDAHLKSLGEITQESLQDFFDAALREKRNVDLDGMTITVGFKIYLNNSIYDDNWWWWTIKNGTIIIDAEHTNNLFTAPPIPPQTTSYPLYGCVCFENVNFINSTVEPNLSRSERWGSLSVYGEWTNNYDFRNPNTETRTVDSGRAVAPVTHRDYQPKTTKVCVFSGNKLCRIKMNNCVFDGVSLVETDAYIQSFYIFGCQIYNLEHNFILATKAYDIHFINNNVDRSMEATVIDITHPWSLQVTDNLIQYVRCAVAYSWGGGITITNNYFEGCRYHVVENYNTNGSLNYGLMFTGNMCFQSEYDIANNGGLGTYYYILFGGVEQGYLIAGNRFYTQQFKADANGYPVSESYPNPTYTFPESVKPLQNTVPGVTNGLFIPSAKHETEGTGYDGGTGVQAVIKKYTGNESPLDGGYCARYLPVERESGDMGYNMGGLNPGGTHRLMVDQMRHFYRAEPGDRYSEYSERLWKATVMDASAPYIPWTYVKRQLASHTRRSELPNTDPEYLNRDVPKDEAIVQSPWVRQALMIDSQFGEDWNSLDLGKPESRVDFTKPIGYYEGLSRFDPSYGIEFWHANKWVDGFGVPVEWKKYGSKSQRPFSSTVITSFTSAGGYVDSSGKWNVEDPTNNYACLIDVSGIHGKHLVFDTTGNVQITFLADDPVGGENVTFATGYSGNVWCNSSSDFAVPSDAKWLSIILKEGSTTYAVNSVTLPNASTPPYGMAAGIMFFDTDINKPTWYTGDPLVGDDGWVDANGENPYET